MLNLKCLHTILIYDIFWNPKYDPLRPDDASSLFQIQGSRGYKPSSQMLLENYTKIDYNSTEQTVQFIPSNLNKQGRDVPDSDKTNPYLKLGLGIAGSLILVLLGWFLGKVYVRYVKTKEMMKNRDD